MANVTIMKALVSHVIETKLILYSLLTPYCTNRFPVATVHTRRTHVLKSAGKFFTNISLTKSAGKLSTNISSAIFTNVPSSIMDSQKN